MRYVILVTLIVSAIVEVDRAVRPGPAHPPGAADVVALMAGSSD
ncbi:hypothetical protein [Methylobacterium sp. JK268]